MTATALLPIHGVRVLGHATARSVAALYGLDHAEVEEHLLDAEASGHVKRSDYVPGSRWSMTDRGRQHGEELLAAELAALGTREDLADAHRAFLPLNHRLGPVMTRWQLRPTAADPLAFNDHTDLRYDDRILRDLGRLAEELQSVTTALESAVPRFGMHQPRIALALDRALDGEGAWVDSPEVPSMNLAWIQLHEDVLASLGIQRGQQPV